MNKHESYVCKLTEKRPNTKVLGTYLDCLTPILHKCLVHGNSYESSPSKVLSRSECSRSSNSCKREKSSRKFNDTIDTLTTKIKEIHKGKITVVEWSNINKGPKVQCVDCLRMWRPTKSNLIAHEKGCKVCKTKKTADTLRKPKIQYLEELASKFNNQILLVGDYLGAKKIKNFKCVVCNFKWSTTRCVGCPQCSFIKSRTAGLKQKQYLLGDRVLNIQGYEDRALDWLLDNTTHKSEEIFVSSEGVLPVIPYRFEGRNRKHYPDIMVRRKDGRTMIIEVKSTFTFGIHSWKGKPRMFQQNKAKLRAAKAQGLDYRFMIFDRKDFIPLPRNWFEYSAPKLAQYLGITYYRY